MDTAARTTPQYWFCLGLGSRWGYGLPRGLAMLLWDALAGETAAQIARRCGLDATYVAEALTFAGRRLGLLGWSLAGARALLWDYLEVAELLARLCAEREGREA